MPHRNKTYMCFGADNDIHYYLLILSEQEYKRIFKDNKNPVNP